ncbi:hypothetical protein FR5810_00685 [Bordetella pertussis]|nr:hypothetical protein FR5810_00685 [Bordetella pertussis]
MRSPRSLLACRADMDGHGTIAQIAGQRMSTVPNPAFPEPFRSPQFRGSAAFPLKPRENTSAARKPGCGWRFSSTSWPPWISMMVRTMASPRPAPDLFLPAAPRRNRTLARAMSSADMPGPLSSTTSQAWPPSAWTLTVTSLPRAVYRMALSTRLLSASRNSHSTACTRTGAACTSSPRSSCLARAAGNKARMTPSASSARSTVSSGRPPSASEASLARASASIWLVVRTALSRPSCIARRAVRTSWGSVSRKA